MFGNLFGGARSPVSGKQRFARIYNLTDFGVTANVVCQPSQWNLVGTVTVPAQQMLTWGANDPVGGSSVAGRTAYMKFMDTSVAQINGKVRLAITNANETNTVIVLEERTEKLAADQNDRTKAVVIPEYVSAYAKEDSKLQILFYPDSAAAVTIDYDATLTDALLPVTVYQ